MESKRRNPLRFRVGDLLVVRPSPVDCGRVVEEFDDDSVRVRFDNRATQKLSVAQLERYVRVAPVRAHADVELLCIDNDTTGPVVLLDGDDGGPKQQAFLIELDALVARYGLIVCGWRRNPR